MHKFRDDYKFKWLFSRKIYDIGRTEFDAGFSKTGLHLPEVIDQLNKERSVVSALSSDVIKAQYEQDMVLNKFLRGVERVKTNNIRLKVNLFTILIDSLVHWNIVKKVYVKVLSGYLKTVFK